MSVNQERCPGDKARGHTPGVAGIDLDEHESLPVGTICSEIGFELLKEGFLELQNLFHVHTGDKRLVGGGRGVGENDIFEFVGAGGKDGGALVDLGGIEQIEDREMLDGEHFVHTFKAETALAIEEVGDMGLLELGLLGKAEAGQFACINAFPKYFAKIVLQDFEPHGAEYSTGLSQGVKPEVFHRCRMSIQP